MIGALEEHRIDYALCGGLAMAVYDRPLATVDIAGLFDLNYAGFRAAAALSIAWSCPGELQSSGT